MTPPKYGVVVAIDRVDKPIPAVESLGKLPAKEKPAEVFVAVGRNPSVQRNYGLNECKSPLVYFLDEDSWVIAGTTPRLVSHFQGERAAVAGGPNLPHPDATDFEKSASAVLASWMGSFKVRNRYASIGSVKEATEKDLILCNLMVRRAFFQKEEGFRPHLYPNEENELLNRLMHAGYQLIYDPAAAIYRPRRKNLPSFCHQSYRYGAGRARQMKTYPCLSDLVHLVPFFFVLYVFSLLAPLVLPANSMAGQILSSWLWRAPFVLFLLLAAGTGISVVSWFRRPIDLIGVPALIFFRQFFYGFGLVGGFFTPIPRPQGDVRLYKAVYKGASYKLVPVKITQRKNAPL
jgi:cellulose synthase/poly-beta-1,6-N-acetylglucosamine synthase-like glycosyltransferase